jgi:Phage capsid family.
MNLEQLKALLAAKNTRAAELEKTIRESQKEDEITAARKELDANIHERGVIEGQITELTRSSAIEAIETAKKALGEEKGADGELKLTTRSAINLAFGLAYRKKKATDEQQRAIDKSLFTTNKVYAAPTAEKDGVNNGGVLIPTLAFMDLLKEDKALTPILEDTVFYNIPGMLSFPIRTNRGLAQVKTEGKGTAQQTVELGTLDLVKGCLQIDVPVTDELEAMTDINVGAWIVQSIEQDLTDDWGAALIYGTGTDNQVSGITNGLTAVPMTAGKEQEGAIKCLHAIKGKCRRGAKLYVSQTFMDRMTSLADTTGRLIYPNGWTVCDGHAVVVDDNLKDDEILAGNVSRFFKANLMSGMTIKQDYSASQGITDYVAKVYCATKALSSAFSYAKIPA